MVDLREWKPSTIRSLEQNLVMERSTCVEWMSIPVRAHGSRPSAAQQTAEGRFKAPFRKTVQVAFREKGPDLLRPPCEAGEHPALAPLPQSPDPRLPRVDRPRTHGPLPRLAVAVSVTGHFTHLGPPLWFPTAQKLRNLFPHNFLHEGRGLISHQLLDPVPDLFAGHSSPCRPNLSLKVTLLSPGLQPGLVE